MTALLTKLRHEPVAFYGGLISALLVILALCGVDEQILATVVTIATLVGIPVTRAQVTPTVKTGSDAGHAELHGILAMAAAILLALTVWSLLGAHTDLFKPW